tara:strand:+ start:143 stop:304 length:162 start_codon:yes stop_codon:yes gene_type:complete
LDRRLSRCDVRLFCLGLAAGQPIRDLTLAAGTAPHGVAGRGVADFIHGGDWCR